MNEVITIGVDLAKNVFRYTALTRVAVMNPVDPMPGKIGQGFNVRVGGQKLRLETSHLAGRSGLSLDSMAADDPPHDRVEAEPVGIVHVVVAAKASENGLAELLDKTVATVLSLIDDLRRRPVPA